MSNHLDHNKVNQIREAIEKAINDLRETFVENPSEFDEALMQVTEPELYGEHDHSVEPEDPSDPHGAGFNKGP